MVSPPSRRNEIARNISKRIVRQESWWGLIHLLTTGTLRRQGISPKLLLAARFLGPMGEMKGVSRLSGFWEIRDKDSSILKRAKVSSSCVVPREVICKQYQSHASVSEERSEHHSDSTGSQQEQQQNFSLESVYLS